MFGFGKSGIMNNELRIQSTPVIADTLGTARVRNRGVREVIHDSETAKRALREKDKGIFIDGQKKRKSTKKDKDSRIPRNCSVSAKTRELKKQMIRIELQLLLLKRRLFADVRCNLSNWDLPSTTLLRDS